MSSKFIALGGSLLVAGTIIVATKSSPKKVEEKKNPVSDLSTMKVIPLSDTTFQLPQHATKFPAILIKKENGDTASVPMRVSAVKMDVKVSGNIATTTFDITYCNDLDRILDGQFCFPLGEGQSISYFALDMDGKLREASVVEKAKGRKTYEAVIRRKIDPALLEWTAGNNFRARVYPIPAHGCKRVVVGFEQELSPTGKSYVYYQPMMFDKKLETFHLRAEVLNQPARPKQYDENGIAMKFDNAGEGWVMEKNYSDYKADKAVAFEIPDNGTARNVFVEQSDKGNAAFYVNIFPKKYTAEKKLPSSVCVLWDVSGSSDKRNISLEKNLLKAYLQKIKTAEVKLVTFSNDLVSEDVFKMENGNTNDLERRLKELVYDGGTQLGILDLSKYKCDEFVLVSDGLSNFGENEIKTSRTPLHVICSSALSDYSYLKGLAQTTGGRFLNMLSTDSASCLSQLCNEEYRFISAEYDKNTLSEVYPSSPQTVTKNFCLSGIIEGHSCEVTLNFGIGNNILQKERITVVNDAKDYKGMIRKIWAQKKLNELDIFYEKNKDEITSLGKQYSIVTRNTSLLVLDRIEDYVEHQVEPKDPDLKKQYLTMVNQTKRNWQQEREAHIEQVVADFQEVKDWYNTTYSNVPTLKNKKNEGTLGLINASSGAMTDSISTVNYATPTIVNQEQSVVLNATSNAFSNTSNGQTNAPVNAGQATTLSGTGSTTFAWDFNSNADKDVSNLESEKKMDELVAGTYTVNTTDVNGCIGITKSEIKNLESVSSEISLNAWDPNTPYMYAIKSAPKEIAYITYINLKKKYSSQPSFFVDVADYFVKQHDKKTAMRILSNVAEMDLENHQLLRVLAHRLQQLDENKIAIKVYEKILKIREEEPQSFRDLGLAYAQDKQYQKALDNLCKVVNRRWDGRFPQVESFVVCEINNILSTSGANLNLDSLDKRLIKPMSFDVRVVINWDTDNCDMDLWVTDKAQEKCFYSYPLTQSGGKISRDFTGGYGPEVFMIKKAVNGSYKVQVNYYGSTQQGLTGPTTVQAELYTNYGRANQTKKTITLRLEDRAEVIDLGSLAFGK